eukprot:gene10413-13988_t
MDVELKDTLNKAWKDDKSGFGFKMLQKMGWKEDKGLGKNENGITNSVKIKKREDGLGLGMKKLDGNNSWSETATSFNDVLNILKANYVKDKKKKDKKSKVVKSIPKISVGMKYKRHKEAKDLKNKSDHDLKAILGAALINKDNDEKSSFYPVIKMNQNGESSEMKNDDNNDAESHSDQEIEKKPSKKSKRKKLN